MATKSLDFDDRHEWSEVKEADERSRCLSVGKEKLFTRKHAR